MSILSQLTGLLNWNTRSQAEVLSSHSNPLAALIGAPSRSGVVVNSENTLGLPAYWGALRIISEALASLPGQPMERRKDGSIHPAEKDPTWKLMRVQPNNMYSSYDLKLINGLDLCHTGNYFNRIYSNRGTAKIEEIVRLDPKDVEILFVHDKRIILYEVATKDAAGVFKKEILEHDRIEHVKIMSKDGIVGRNPTMVMKDAFGSMISAQGYINDFWANGAQMSGVLSSKQPLTIENQKQAAENFSSAARNGRTAVLGADFSYTRISATPSESDYVAVSQMTDKQINQAYRIPAHMNGDLSRSTNNNIEQQTNDFLTWCLRPLLKSIENEKNRKYWRGDKQERFFFDFNLDALLRADTEARAAFYNTMITLGVYSINEVRGLEKMNKIEGGDGHRVQLNMVDLSKADQVATSPTKPQANA